jgi:hypothetical protein
MSFKTQNAKIEESLITNNVVSVPVLTTTSQDGNLQLDPTSNLIHIISGSASNFKVNLPDATQCEVGLTFEIFNKSSRAIEIRHHSGSVIAVISPESSYRVCLFNTNTEDGEWGIFSPVAVSPFDDMREPTGVVDRSQSVMSFDPVTRTFKIEPTGDNFKVYIRGRKMLISTALEYIIPNTSGSYFFYINDNHELDVLTTFDTSLLDSLVYVAYVLWDAVDSQVVAFSEERHGITMDGSTHGYLHSTRGTQLISGGSISFVGVEGTGNNASDAQIGITNSIIADEDIRITITHSNTPTADFEQVLSPVAKIPLYYRGSSGTWRKLAATDYPVRSGIARAQYNLFSAGSWSLADASEGHYIATFVFATNNINEPVVGVIGQEQYASIIEAKNSATWESLAVGQLPMQEMKLLHRVIFQTSINYTNAVKAAIRDVSDFRYVVDRSISSISSDHGSINYSIISATNTISTTSTTFVLDTDLSVTPQAGTWLALVSASVSNSNNERQSVIALAKNGIVDSNSERQMSGRGSTNFFEVSTFAYFTVSGTDPIALYYRAVQNTASLSIRSLTLIRVM